MAYRAHERPVLKEYPLKSKKMRLMGFAGLLTVFIQRFPRIINITDFNDGVVKLDTEYIARFRISQDIKIILLTIKAVLAGNGAM